MRSLVFAAVAFVSAAAAHAQAPAEKKSEPVVLTGCVGEGVDRGTYYVANLTRTDMDTATFAKEPNAIFALDSPKKLRDHVKKMVEIRGTVERPKETNSGKVDRESDAMRIDAKGRKVTRIPEGTAGAAAAASGGVGSARMTYKVKVKEVKRMGDNSCM